MEVSLLLVELLQRFFFKLMKDNDRFYKSYKDKGRMEGLLSHIPIYVIRPENEIGLLGSKWKAKTIAKKLGTQSKL